ncbi:type I-E CRISPR-associated endonuclease Cas1e [Sorangium sp. So ce861]|uniref:type I-E CRISPR-associated endonuclease Cas1e n=1 Tax=Sorangium sp. So ce861 TaxID=3133323 RepID=UPI003F63CD71
MSRGGSLLRDLQQLPRFSDGWTFLYTDKVRIERDDSAIVLIDAEGQVPVPVAALSVLMLGPGVSITHAAMLALSEAGCSVVWCGEEGTRFYASGVGETRRASNLMAQAEAWASAKRRAEVVARMYRMRFAERLDPDLTLEQIRGMEGVRVREAYAKASRETGLPWSGRAYRRGDWGAADPVNRALSTANACLYGLCHAAIVSTGFSPALGFVHTGKMLSFVYDVADLYKVEVTVPIAFKAAAMGTASLESNVRRLCRTAFHDERLLQRIVPDMQRALGLKADATLLVTHAPDDDAPGALWDPARGSVPGGKNFAEVEQAGEMREGREGHEGEVPPDSDGGVPF